jgi:hypothetical protein
MEKWLTASPKAEVASSNLVGCINLSSGLRRVQIRPGPLWGTRAGLLCRPACVPAYFIVGMTNSAPARMPVGQRLVMVFSRE